jgi:hypothetical protein
MATAPHHVALSARGLSNIRYRDDLNDFEFIVGREHYQCPWFVASFLSGRIAEARSVDDTICEFSVVTKDARNVFSRFLSLGRGAIITVSGDELRFYE